MTPPAPGPSILAITRDTAYLRGLRLEMPLFNLKKQGLIRDYFITNPSLFDIPDDFEFDVVWLQRINDPKLIEHLSRKIDNCYLYDLDDLLIGSAAYRRTDLPNKEAVLDAVHNCRVLSVTSARLAVILGKYARPPVSEKAVVCPNAFEFSGLTRKPARPSGILFTSSEELPLTDASKAILGSVADFSQQHKLPVLYFGPKNEDLTRTFPLIRSFGPVSYWHYHAILAALQPMIGIAALETSADERTLDFVNAKSDVKMLDFGGFGHPAVYSKAPPYVDTDLKAGVLAENTPEAWSAALDVVYEQTWKTLDIEQKRISEQRNMDLIASRCWTEALSRARLPEHMTGREIRYSRGKGGFFFNAAKHMVFAQDHIFRKRLGEEIPKPLLKLLRKYVLNS